MMLRRLHGPLAVGGIDAPVKCTFVPEGVFFQLGRDCFSKMCIK